MNAADDIRDAVTAARTADEMGTATAADLAVIRAADGNDTVALAVAVNAYRAEWARVHSADPRIARAADGRPLGRMTTDGPLTTVAAPFAYVWSDDAESEWVTAVYAGAR